jgi:hypothetical protein
MKVFRFLSFDGIILTNFTIFELIMSNIHTIL